VADYAGVQKLRRADKTFAWLSSPPGTLFGQGMWRPQKRLVVTEGEIDCISYGEATDCKWPVVSVPNGAGGAARSIADNIEFVEGFEEVVFLFDMDEPGQAAALECAQLLTPGKAFIGVMARKDANEVLVELGRGELYNAPFKAKVYRPDGIVEGMDLLDEVIVPPARGLSYPWAALNDITYGMRRGEMTTWIAGTGVGKSQVLREVTRHIWVQHEQRVGVIALEESNGNSAIGQVALEMNLKLHLPDVREKVDDAAVRAAGEKILPGFAFYDHFGSVEADVLLPKIRYMAHAMGIKWIVLDHISIMVSGMAAEGDERKRIDQLVTQLRSLVSELDLGLHIVSHLRKANGVPHEEGGQVSLQDIRGSGAPAQMSNMVIAIERNQQADGASKDVSRLRVLKNRYTGVTGLAGTVTYAHDTGRLVEGGKFQEKKDDGCEF
jgi:twinkle protein